MSDSVIPLRQRVGVGICSVSQWLESVRHLTSPSKVVKVSLMNESLKAVDVNERGATQAVTSSFNVSFKASKHLLSGVAGVKTVTEMTARAKRKDVFDTEWPEKVKVSYETHLPGSTWGECVHGQYVLYQWENKSFILALCPT